MVVVESVVSGRSAGSIPFSAVASSRKDKKKQVKEQRDRQKQVEKKKRRLEKALATSAAIRTELEKKKQKKKEEEERLDEEGAALAEAVALHVLVEEDSESLSLVSASANINFDVAEIEATKSRSPQGTFIDTGNFVPYLGIKGSGEYIQLNGFKCHGSLRYYVTTDRDQKCFKDREVSLKSPDLKLLDGKVMQNTVKETAEMKGERGQRETRSGSLETLDVINKAEACIEKESAAEMTAGIVAAQAVSALCIAEERTDARALEKASKVVKIHFFERNSCVHL